MEMLDKDWIGIWMGCMCICTFVNMCVYVLREYVYILMYVKSEVHCIKFIYMYYVRMYYVRMYA